MAKAVGPFYSTLKSFLDRSRVPLVAVSLIAVCLLVITLQGGLSSPVNFVLVIDGGSTGTRLFAYKWREKIGDVPQLELISMQAAAHKIPRHSVSPEKRAFQRLETEPGLDAFVGDLQGLRNTAIGPLLDWAKAVVPRTRWHLTPVFLLGTAGIRKLPLAAQHLLLVDVRKTLKAAPFRFEEDWARVISGVEEGVYGWVALNYLAGSFGEAGIASGVVGVASGLDPSPEVTGKGTVGALDLGGSSLEVTYVVGEESLSPTLKTSLVTVNILGLNYSLYTYVHQHYGLNDAFARSIPLALPGVITPARSLPHPCLNPGFNASIDLGSSQDAVRLTGGYDWQKCQDLVRSVVNASSHCPEAPCSLGRSRPKTSSPFYALTGFFVVYKFFGLSPEASLADLEEAGRAFCSRNWAEVQVKLGHERRLEEYCFRVPYIVQLLTEGLDLPETQIRVGTGQEGWALGAALVEGGKALHPGQATAVIMQRSPASGLMWGGIRNVFWFAVGLVCAAWLLLLWWTSGYKVPRIAWLSEKELGGLSDDVATIGPRKEFRRTDSGLLSATESGSRGSSEANILRGLSVPNGVGTPLGPIQNPGLYASNIQPLSGASFQRKRTSSVQNFDIALKSFSQQ